MVSVRRWFGTLRALALPVLGSTVLSVAGLALVRDRVPIAVLRSSNNEVGNYLQTVGTIYAVLLAFVVVVVWNQFNETRALVDREANELFDLYRTARGFPADTSEPIVRGLRAYVDDVIQREWAGMARGNDSLIEEVGRHLDVVWAQILRLEPQSESHCALYSEMLSRFNDLSDCRTGRLSASRMRAPLALRILLYTGAFIIVASMYLLAIDLFLIHALCTGALAGAVSHVLYIIMDLDNPFHGDWQIPAASFERVRRYMQP